MSEKKKDETEQLEEGQSNENQELDDSKLEDVGGAGIGVLPPGKG